jgi:hypothetical protein
MTEEETPQEVKQENPIDQINKRYDEVKQANDKLQQELLRSEELRTRQIMGGQSNAGNNKTPKDLEDDKINDEVSKIVKSFKG